MKQPKRPDFIRHWRELEVPVSPASTDENFGFASEFAAASGLTHLRVAHLRLPAGARAYPPIAMRDDEVFFFVLEGAPDLWLDGYLHRLKEGVGVSLNAGTGQAHSFINNSDKTVRLFVMSEGPRFASQAIHPVDAKANENLANTGRLWEGTPARKRGPHDGLSDSQRGGRGRADKRGLPTNALHWHDLLEDKPSMYKGSDEPQGLNAKFGKRARFSRIGVHVEVLKPGRRTSWPHAERDEEEFVFVVDGMVDCWIDGRIHPIGEGDFVGWRGGDGITHVVINNSDTDALLVVGGEASRYRSRVWYPFHPHRRKEVGENYWDDHPVPKLGAHDGMPDALRARVPQAARSSALKANTAAIRLKPRKR